MATHLTSRVLILLALIAALTLASSCSTTTETVAPSELPSIRGFSNDTAKIGTGVYVFGKNLAFCMVWLGDRKLTLYDSIYSNFVSFFVPSGATTDYVYVSNDGVYRAQSPRKLVVTGQTAGPVFYVDKISRDSASVGERVAIYGRGILSRKDSLALLLNNITVPIDETYDDSLIFHVPASASTGQLSLVDRNQSYWNSTFAVTVPLEWHHVRISIVGFGYRAAHRRTGTVDHRRSIDSSWFEHEQLDWTTTLDLNDAHAIRQTSSTQFVQGWSSSMNFPSSVIVTWADTGWSYISLQIRGHSNILLPLAQSADTNMVVGGAAYGGPPDPHLKSQLTLPMSAAGITIYMTRSEADHEGDHNWTESITTAGIDGVGRIEIVFEP